MPDPNSIESKGSIGLVASAAAVRECRSSSIGLIKSCLSQIDSCEQFVRAWQHVESTGALKRARELDACAPSGVLHGVPIGVKDVIDTVDMPTAYGSDVYRGYRPAADATAVALLRAAGAIILGKTVSTEFASVAPSRTANPADLRHTPGGSSSGSAAAVAAGMVPAALGTQTAGSVIRPAAYCGIVGFKPTFGLADATGVKALARSFDTLGVLARSVEDAALLTAVIADRPAMAACRPAARPRFALCTPPWVDERSAIASRAVTHAADVAVAAGAEVLRIELPEGYDELLDIQQAIMDWDMVHALSFEWDQARDRMQPETRSALLTRRARMTPEKLDAAQRALSELRRTTDRKFAGFDAVLVPAAPGEAPAGYSSTGSSDFNRGWTALHVPCATIPVGRGPLGLPVGVQLVGPRGGDIRLLAAAAVLEEWLSRRAPAEIAR